MFFRRQKVKIDTFEDRLQSVQQAGFAVTRDGGGRPKVTRNGFAAVVEEIEGGKAALCTRADDWKRGRTIDRSWLSEGV